MTHEVQIGLNAVIVAVTEETPRILTVTPRSRAGDSHRALPFGPLDPERDRTLERALRRWVREQTAIELGYVEQLYTFGDRGRGVGLADRLVSVAYLALVQERELATEADARWHDWYEFFPWEDWRQGRPRVIEVDIAPALTAWVASANDSGERSGRQERVEIMFGLRGAPWDGERVLERYELLYEAGLVEEARRDRRTGTRGRPGPALGRAMTVDHRRIAATALGRTRGKLKYRPVVFELLPPNFTLTGLQRVVEALAGVRLHTQNFRRLLDRSGLVEGTGERDLRTGGRPAELFRFRREVLRERPAPGVGLPGLRTSG